MKAGYVSAAVLAILVALGGQMATFSSDHNEVTEESFRLASSGDPGAVELLAKRLGDAAWLARLDASKTSSNFAHVWELLRNRPSAATEKLCLSLSDNAFYAHTWRLNYLLSALSEVRPMSAAGAHLFQETGHAEYYALNGPLLAANGSERAVAVLKTLLMDSGKDSDVRADVAQRSLFTHRTQARIVQMSREILRETTEERFREAVLSALFASSAAGWWGKQLNMPEAPAWVEASPETLEALLTIVKENHLESRQEFRQTVQALRTLRDDRRRTGD